MANIAWTKPEIFGIKWDTGPNRAAEPLTEITHDEFLAKMHCGAFGLEGLCYGGSAPLPEHNDDKDRHAKMWVWQYYFFHRYALAVAYRYTMKAAPDSQCVVKDGVNSGDYEVRFFRLGCLHPKMTTEWPRMHDRHDNCPDCGFHGQYDSSG